MVGEAWPALYLASTWLTGPDGEDADHLMPADQGSLVFTIGNLGTADATDVLLYF